MGILSGNPKEEPMHYGEVFGLWSFVSVTKGCLAAYQTYLNHIGDKDLHKLILEVIDQCKQEIKEGEALLKENGVGLPPSPPERPEACLEDIPVGARFQDMEISAAVAMEIAAGLVTCSKLISQSIREDLATMFAQIHMQKATIGAKFLRLNKEKGWLVPPPLHTFKQKDC
ncbi:DUF3231 family protein [Priestia endophytica]|jgi:hypothetical protein|uniref:DUF3231 family protein n=1 Tax=Priestia endophytica DSM 13796 TaxID=1121089 RepID=A0A1I5YRQ3_9BACI|nr:DUF3231 family protein [Priestia endophytica]KAB2495295.1 DUF3231 family protein [Priestia endophytica]KYG26309.1 hypothetical protein AZF06_17475 [Priestia endophytica]MBG9813928.1 membrane protein [Priestia endophytica]MED4072626.1 DUF3231 family protein [Priestia endophytica]RAS86079.1 hypothetical protein A4R27_02630 [Priestia endophytica]